MAVERRDYVALEWVAGEIAETLKQSIAELDAYLDNRADVTRLRFCLTYIHQVYGTLKMVEFAGAALLAEEMEAVAQALVAATVIEAQREDALLALKTALDSLPNYLQRLLVQRRDAPALLLPLINDLRAVRGEVLITESAVFSPDLTTKVDASAQPLSISAGELSEIAKKLRQMYQMALLNYLRNNDPRQNLNYLAKVCARLGKLATARPSEALWKICIALCEGLLNRSIQPSAAVKLLLRQVDSQLKILVEQGEAALQAEPPLGLIKNLLYYVAASGANSRYIAEIKQAYNLPNALPPETEVVPAGDDEATNAVKAALAQQLANLAQDLPNIPVGKGLIAAIKRVQDTAALLGMTRAQATLQDLVQRVLNDRLDIDAAVRSLHQLAEGFELEQRPAAPRPLFNDSEEAQEQLDKAFDAVMRESRNSLEQAKEAIIEFVATQWRHQCLEDVPELLAGVRGSFAVAGLHRAAAVLAACENYVRKDLLEQKKIPAWQLLDTLADAIASVDYYVERLSEDAAAECESILDIAEESVAALAAQPAQETTLENIQPAPVSAQVIPFQRPGAPVEDDVERFGEDSSFAEDSLSAEGSLLAEGSSLFNEDQELGRVHSFSEAADEREQAAAAFETKTEFALPEENTEEEHAEIEAAADDAAQALAFAPPVEAAAASDASDEDAPDQEIIDIFIEEAGEVLDTIAEYFPQWREQPSDHETLSTIRRAFHTLKGSGRMVGAIEIGELAWSIENMLNRVMDGTLFIDAARLDVAAEAAQLLPPMVEAFQQRRANVMAPVEALMARALLLSKQQVIDTEQQAPSLEAADIELQPAAELTAHAEADSYEFEQLAPHLAPEIQQFSVDDDLIGERPADQELRSDSYAEVESEAEADEDDNVLLDIFIAEAATHVQTVDDFVRYADQLAGPAELSDDLQRALHTLKGSAHMADVAGIAQVVTPVEHLVKELRAAQLKADPDVMAVLQQSVDMIRAGLAELTELRHYQVPGADDFVQAVDALRYSRLALIDTEAEQSGDGISPAAVNQFLSDAIELISGVGDDIRSWRDRRLDDQRQHTLAATISQVADSAEALNLAPVVDLAQALQTLLRVGADAPALDDSFYALASVAAERLIDMLDRLAANQRPDVDSELLTALQEYDFDAASLSDDIGDAAIAAPADFLEPMLDDAELLDSQLLDIPVLQDVVEPAPLTLTDHLDKEPAAPIAALFDEYFEEPKGDFEALADSDDSGEKVHHSDYSLIDEHLEPPSIAVSYEASAYQEKTPSSQHAEFELAAEFVAETADANLENLDDQHTATENIGAEYLAEQYLAAQRADAETAADSGVDMAAIAEAEQNIDSISAAASEAEPEYLSDRADTTAESLGETAPQDLDYAYAVVQEANAQEANAQEANEQPSAGDASWTASEEIIAAPTAATTFTIDAPTASMSSSSDDEEIDTEILEIFIEEAGDLLEAIDEAILHWGSDRDNSIYLDDLQRLLHTLKGGARLAGLKNLGNLSHNFETLLINSQQQSRVVDDELLAEVQAYQDQLIRLVDAVKQHGHSGDQMATDAAAASLQAATQQELPPIAEVNFNADAEYEAEADLENNADLASAADESNAADTEAEFLPAQQRADEPAAKVLAFARPKTAPEPFAAPSLRQAESLRETESLPELGGVTQQLRRGPQEVVKISAQLLEQLVNLAGETSIARGRAEEQVNEFVFSLDEMQITVDRLHEQVRRLDLETEAQMLFRQEQVESEGLEGFDPLEFDRYSLLQQLSRSLLESASDLVDIKNTLAEKSRDMETLLVQQSRINTELQEGLMRSRMVPFARMVPRLRRIVRQVAGELEKQVEFYVDNAEGELDRTVLERIVAPLEHMLRNALDHGVETVAERVVANKPEQGTIVLSVTREGGDVVLTLTDDGRGIDLNAVRDKAIARGLMEVGANLSDHEVMQFILQSGFSTAKQVTQISGRGVGMDVVYSEIKQLGGNLEIDSAWGKGTRFIVRLPFTVSVNRALMVAGCGDVYAIPLNTIEGIVRVSPFELEAYYQPDAPLFEYAGQPYLMRYIGALLRTGDKPNLEGHTTPLPVLLVRGSDHAVAIQVDSLMGSREIVVKTLGPQFGLVQGLSGATVLGDGSVVVILDLMAMIRADASHLHRDLMLGQEEAHADRDRPLLVMVVDDSVTVRKVTSRFLERQGMEVILAKDGIDAINLLQDSDRIPDVMLLDIEMPRMDGFEVASRIRHTSRLRDLPIIMITSRTGDKHRDRAAALGVNKYLGKPYQETLLLDTIHELTGTVVSE